MSVSRMGSDEKRKPDCEATLNVEHFTCIELPPRGRTLTQNRRASMVTRYADLKTRPSQ
jgi:hypothetical protein